MKIDREKILGINLTKGGSPLSRFINADNKDKKKAWNGFWDTVKQGGEEMAKEYGFDNKPGFKK